MRHYREGKLKQVAKALWQQQEQTDHNFFTTYISTQRQKKGGELFEFHAPHSNSDVPCAIGCANVRGTSQILTLVRLHYVCEGNKGRSGQACAKNAPQRQ
jgi:hypothetical protein